MRKLKVYLDTSVISHLLQEDVPEKMSDTRQLWEIPLYCWKARNDHENRTCHQP